MSGRIPPVPPGDLDPYGAARNVRATERSVTKFRLVSGPEVPASPPADVLNALDSAARVHEELQARGLNVAFDLHPNGGVQISVLDRRGAVVRAFPAAAGLDALSGDLPLDELGT
jgi:hypothetical protein